MHDGQILLGMSCVGCHAGGAQDLSEKLAQVSLLRFDDAKMTPKRIGEVFDNELLARRARRAGLRWTRSLRAINGRAPDENQASWQATQAEFAADVDLAKAAAELGATEAALTASIERWLASNRDPLVTAIVERPITREQFEQIFPTLRQMWQGQDETAVARVFAGRGIQ